MTFLELLLWEAPAIVFFVLALYYKSELMVAQARLEAMRRTFEEMKEHHWMMQNKENIP